MSLGLFPTSNTAAMRFFVPVAAIALASFFALVPDYGQGQEFEPRRWPPCCSDKDCVLEDGCVKPQHSPSDEESTAVTMSPGMLVGCCIPRNYPVEQRVCTTAYNQIDNTDPQWSDPPVVTTTASEDETDDNWGHYDTAENSQRPAYPCCANENCWLARNETCRREAGGRMGHCTNSGTGENTGNDPDDSYPLNY